MIALDSYVNLFGFLVINLVYSNSSLVYLSLGFIFRVKSKKHKASNEIGFSFISIV